MRLRARVSPVRRKAKISRQKVTSAMVTTPIREATRAAKRLARPAIRVTRRTRRTRKGITS